MRVDMNCCAPAVRFGTGQNPATTKTGSAGTNPATTKTGSVGTNPATTKTGSG